MTTWPQIVIQIFFSAKTRGERWVKFGRWLTDSSRATRFSQTVVRVNSIRVEWVKLSEFFFVGLSFSSEWGVYLHLLWVTFVHWVYANESPSVSVLNKSPHQSAAILEGSRAGRFINWRNISEIFVDSSLFLVLSKCNWGRYRPSAHHKRSPIDGHGQFQCLNGWNEEHFHWKLLVIRIARAKSEDCSQCAQAVNHLQRHPAL